MCLQSKPSTLTERELRDPFLITRPMPWNVWLLRTMILEPERIASKAEIAAHMEARFKSLAIVRGGKLETVAETRERIEFSQWKAGQAKGLLKPTSPLNSERRGRAA